MKETQESAAKRKWVQAWRRAAPTLKRMREEEIRTANTDSAIAAFDGLVSEWVREHPPEPSSGLVEQQRWFRLLAENA